MPPLATEQPLARTYSHPSVADPYDVVQQHRDVMRYPSDASSTAVARELDLPRGRVRPWLDGRKPDAVRAIEVARSNGWFAEKWSSPTPALATLCLGIFACGGIARSNYFPSWTPSTDIGRTELTNALEAAAIPYRTQSEREGRSAELKPQTDGSVLGRVLATAGAPTGSKTADDVTFPSWVEDAPDDLRRRIARLFVCERGINYPEKDTRRIQTDRSQGYYRRLTDLIADVTGESVTVSDAGITISAAAVRSLNDQKDD